MKKITTILVTLLSIAMLPYVSYGAPLEQTDHAIIGAGENVYCGVKNTANREPWILHVAATVGGGGGTLTIMFRDGDVLDFNIAANSSFSTVQAMGGVPDVDDVVRVNGSAGVTGMVSARVIRNGTRDPFGGDGFEDNFCNNTTDEPGATLAGANPWGNPLP